MQDSDEGRYSNPNSGKESHVKPDSGEGPYTKLIAVGTVVLVLLTYVLAASAVHWWPFENANAGVATPCKFLVGSVDTCSSHDSQVTVDFLSAGNTTGCTFNMELQWGDGSVVQEAPLSGGPVGSYFLANHTYAAPGTYVIQETGTATGVCSTFPVTYN